MQVALPLGQRQAAQIDAILGSEIEGQEHQLAFVWMAGAHLGHQPIEMHRASGIDQAKLAIEDRRLRGQLAECLDHARQTVGVFGTVTRIEPDPVAVLDDLKPEAIPFGLVQPIVAFGWANGCGWGERTDERRGTGTI